MTASALNMQLREGVRRLFGNDWFIVISLALIAAAVRWLFVLYHPRLDGFLIYQGMPLSDGCSYTFKAISIAQGHGIPPAQQPAVRPFYPIALACLYTWTGFSLAAVVVLNIATAAVTAGLIYLCGARALNRFCGLGTALFFSVDPSQLMQTSQAGTEPLGLLFFVASVYAAFRAFESRSRWLFFFTGLFIGLSNLTRTLTILTLPLYLVLIPLLVGIRRGAWKNTCLCGLVMIFGTMFVLLPWIVRQEKMYRIWSISDNIGEAFYAATSPKYKQWTPAVRQDAEADGIPDTVGDRYRYFMRRAGENMRRNSGFYLRNVGASLWEYANTFNPSSRASLKYIEAFSSAAAAARALLYFTLLLLTSLALLRKEHPFSIPNLVWFLGVVSLCLIFYALPYWLGFVPVLSGVFLSWRRARRLAGLVLFGSLIMAVLGSAIFANPTLFRAILMTDWLFLLYFFAAIWFALEGLKRLRVVEAYPALAGRSGDLEDSTPFQRALSLWSRRSARCFVTILIGFFAVSGVRLMVLTIANPPRKWERQLSGSEADAVIGRLRQPPLAPLGNNSSLQVFNDWNKGSRPQPGNCVVLVQKFDYDYYIPAGKLPPRGRPQVSTPYARTLVIFPQLDFMMPGEIPAELAQQPLVFVGFVAAQAPSAQQLPRPQVEGIAVIPLDQCHRPIFNRVVCAPPAIALHPASGR
jgi:hypothetical protein